MTKEERREYNRKWRESNPEYFQKWHESNPEYTQKYNESIKNHCVYCLETPDHKMYVGSTNSLYYRIKLHQNKVLKHPDRLLYKSIQETGGWEKVKVHILIKDIPDRDLRRKLEQHFINLIPEQLSLNMVNAVLQ